MKGGDDPSGSNMSKLLTSATLNSISPSTPTSAKEALPAPVENMQTSAETSTDNTSFSEIATEVLTQPTLHVNHPAPLVQQQD